MVFQEIITNNFEHNTAITEPSQITQITSFQSKKYFNKISNFKYINSNCSLSFAASSVGSSMPSASEDETDENANASGGNTQEPNSKNEFPRRKYSEVFGEF
jgi:hypothetical protein